MSLFRSIFGGEAPGEGQRSFVEMDELSAVHASIFPDEAARNASMAEQRARTASKVAIAANWWETEMTKLADQHARAVSAITQNSQNMSTNKLKQGVAEAGEKLKIAQKILLQQSDARWGEDVTDKALHQNNEDAFGFRWDRS